VILVDVNLLVYAKMDSLKEHEASRAWLEGRLSGIPGVGLPWQSLQGFLRVTTNPRIFERPLSVDDAWSQVREWLELPNVFSPEPASRYVEILASLMPQVGRPEHVPDAHLAALAIEYGLTLQTTDRDFARFLGLKWENPLR
jgi:toxin-antitoxin system PIN domain toxin